MHPPAVKSEQLLFIIVVPLAQLILSDSVFGTHESDKIKLVQLVVEYAL